MISLFATALLEGRQPITRRRRTDPRFHLCGERGRRRAAGGGSARSRRRSDQCRDRWAISLKQLLLTMNGIVESQIGAVYKEPRAGDVRDSQADIRRPGCYWVTCRSSCSTGAEAHARLVPRRTRVDPLSPFHARASSDEHVTSGSGLIKGVSPVRHRRFASIAALMVVLPVLAPGPAFGQLFFPRDTPKFPQARTWMAQKAKLPPYSPPRTPDGQPDLQGVWSGPVGGGNDDIEEHEYMDMTTPPQESYISEPGDGKALHAVGAGQTK